jgi:hypothetical protein
LCCHWCGSQKCGKVSQSWVLEVTINCNNSSGSYFVVRYSAFFESGI